MNSIETLMRAANPVLDPELDIDDADVQALLALTLTRSTDMDAKELTRPIHEDQKPANRWWMAAVAFAAVIIAVGAAVLLIPNTNDSPPATTLNQSVSSIPQTVPTTTPTQSSSTTEAEPSGPVMTVEKVAFVAAYTDAFNSRDLDAFEELHAPDFSRAFQSTPDLQVRLDFVLEETANLWNQESTIELEACVPTETGVSCIVKRTGPVELGLIGGPHEIRYQFRLDGEGRIESVLYGQGNGGGPFEDNFVAWLEATHPDVAEGLEEPSIVDTFAGDDSEIYLEWVPIWVELGRPTP